MGINLTPPTLKDMKPRITVMGVGGAGGNAINNMISSGLEGVEFIAANTDIQALLTSSAEQRIQLGTNVTEGLGAGAKPEIGEAAAEEALDEIRAQITGSHMVFIACGMGGGTGTGAASVIARVAQEEGILTVGIVTKPFQFEGARRMRIANAGIDEMKKFVDTMIVIPNQNLFRITNEKTTFAEAFLLADQVLYSGIACIVDLIVKEGLINLDFADVRVIMKDMGTAMMGTGEGEGEHRAITAAEEAISNPLLDELTLEGARGLLISIVGSSGLTLYEIEEAASRIHKEVHPDANIMVGASYDESLQDRIRVSIVASGMDMVQGAEDVAAPGQDMPPPLPPQSQQQVPAQSPSHAPAAIQTPGQTAGQTSVQTSGQTSSQTSSQTSGQPPVQTSGQPLTGALQQSEVSRAGVRQPGTTQTGNSPLASNAQSGAGHPDAVNPADAVNPGAAAVAPYPAVYSPASPGVPSAATQSAAAGMVQAPAQTQALAPQTGPSSTIRPNSRPAPTGNDYAQSPARGQNAQGAAPVTPAASVAAQTLAPNLTSAAPAATRQLSPAAAKGAAWQAPGNVMIEEAPPQLSQVAGAPQPSPLPSPQPASAHAIAGGAQQTSSHFAPAPPQSLGVPVRKMPVVEDFPLVGQRDYHAKSSATATNSAASVPTRSSAAGSPAKKVGFFERLTGRRSSNPGPVSQQPKTGTRTPSDNSVNSARSAGSGAGQQAASDSNQPELNSTQSSLQEDNRARQNPELPLFFDQGKR